MCDTSVIFYYSNRFINNDSAELKKIVQNAFDGKIETNAITNYVTSIIPTFIPLSIFIFIPFITYSISNRYKFEIQVYKNMTLFSFFIVVLFSVTCLTCISAYDILVSSKMSLCEVNNYISENYALIEKIINKINRFQCNNLKINLDLYKTLEPIVDVANKIYKEINYYYSIGFIMLQMAILPLTIFSLMLCTKCKKKRVYYTCFSLIVTVVWVMSSLTFPLSFIMSGLSSTVDDITINPYNYLGNNCNVNLGVFEVNACDAIKTCFENKNNSLIESLFNQTENQNSASPVGNFVSSAIEDSIGTQLTPEQTNALVEIFINDNSIEVLDTITGTNGSSTSDEIIEFLTLVNSNIDLFTNQTNDTNAYFANVIEQIPTNDTLSSEELNGILNNDTLIPESFNGNFLDSINLLQNRRLEENFIDLSDNSFVCPARIFNYIVNEEISCSVLVDLYETIKVNDISNSMFIYFLTSLLFCVLSFILLPFFTDPGSGRVINIMFGNRKKK